MPAATWIMSPADAAVTAACMVGYWEGTFRVMLKTGLIKPRKGVMNRIVIRMTFLALCVTPRFRGGCEHRGCFGFCFKFDGLLDGSADVFHLHGL